MSHDVSVSVRHHMVMRRSFSLCFIYTFAVGILCSQPLSCSVAPCPSVEQ